MFTDPSTGGLATFDIVLANPPFSLEKWGREVWEDDPWGRAFAGVNISRYVLPPIGRDIPPLAQAVADFKAALERCREAGFLFRPFQQ